MIRHIVLFSAKTPKNIEPIYQGLKTLETIQGDWTLTVTKNTKQDQIANEIDVVVYGEFPNETTLNTYKADPVYQNAITIVRPLRNKRIAVDIPA